MILEKDFYPTPTAVIERMLSGINVDGLCVLEPSAGSGNIVSFLKKNGASNVIACEINKDLAKIVQKKADRFLKTDFLDVRSDEVSHIDMIVMNPPFSEDEKHIIHAFEIAPSGCTIISLCNSSVIDRVDTRAKKEIKNLIKNHGKSESFGECFGDAERRTYVDISCIWLFKPKSGEKEFADFFSLDEEVEQTQEGLQRYNYVRDMVSRYVDAVSKYDEAMEKANAINAITSTIYNYGIKFGAYRTNEKQYDNITRDVFKKELQKSCWSKIFEEMKMEKYLTKGVRENINKFVEQQQNISFTMKNVYQMIYMVIGTHDSRMDKVLCEAFDMICSFSYKDNCTGGDGWKTNSDYMINKKFIVPYICECGYSGNVGIRYGYRSSNSEEISDIVRALCYITRTNFDSIPELRLFCADMNKPHGYGNKNANPLYFGQWAEWGFFRIKGFKKGTMHFEFLDENIWMEFNRRVAKIKGWRLPENTKKRRA